jgi:uncharacterized protein involved in cysteine biosynthesis
LRVVWQGVALALGLLLGIFLCLLGLVEWWVPGQIVLPFIGPIGGVGWAAGIGLALLMLLTSVFLMVPIASAFSSLFLEQVAEAVEDVHYPGPPGRTLSLWEGITEGAGLLILMILLNLVALALSLVVGPLAPLLFMVVNGWLLGREYFLLAALRHMEREEARALMARNIGQVWLAGTLMAAPLSLPLINLFVPVMGAATFTHLFLRLNVPKAR